MLIQAKRSTSECLSTKFNKRILDTETNYHNSKEVIVSEKIFEWIENISSKISAIEFVDELKEYKCMEEDCIVNCSNYLVLILILMLEFRNSKDIICKGKDERKSNYLIQALEYNVSLHVSTY